MGKRASATGKAAGSPAKAAKVAPSPVAKSPEDDLMHELYKVLRSRCDVATAEMLVSALPLALKEVEGTERHSFQNKMLDAAAKELSDAVSSQKGTVEELMRVSEALEQDKAQSDTVSADIATRLGQKKQACDDTAEAMKSREEAVAEKRAAWEAAKMLADVADGEKQGLEKNRDDFACGLTDLWQPLKASKLAGNRWQERNKKIAQLVKKFQEIGVEESLLVATQTALKMKADARGEFAQEAVSCAEEAYTTHIDALKEKVENFGTEISERAAAMSEVEAAAREAQEALDAATEANIAAQNVWADETNADLAHKAKVEVFGSTAASLQKKLEAMRAEVLSLETVAGTFESRRCGKPLAVAEAAPAEEAPAEAAAPQNEAAAAEP